MWVRCLQGGIALLSFSLAPKCTVQVWTSGQQLVYLQNSSFDDLFSRYLDEQQVRSLCSEVNRIWSSANDENLVYYREQVDQLGKIFATFGTPRESQWPDMTSLPNYVEFTFSPPQSFRSLFPQASEDCLDLLSGCLYTTPGKESPPSKL
jgi:hypothetical protein